MKPNKFYDFERTDEVFVYDYPEYGDLFPYFPRGSKNTPYEMGGVVFNYSLNSWDDPAETQRLFELYLQGLKRDQTGIMLVLKSF